MLHSKSSASLHVYKGTKPSLANTQRITPKKNVSVHSVSKLSHDFIDAYNVTMAQKPLLGQIKSKKPLSKFEFKLNPTRKTQRIT